MIISEINERNIWEGFVAEQAPDSFLQSWNWGMFNANTGEKIWRFGFFEGESLCGAALVIKVQAKRGTFLFIPHGPVLSKDIDRGQALRDLKDRLVDLAQEEHAAFIRISPIFEKNDENLGLFRALAFKDAPIHMMHPEKTWLLDLDKDDETLMREMKKNHRNLIRRAIKDGVTIEQSDSEEALRAFYAIHMETVERHNFIPFSYDYISKELEAFKPDKEISIFNARYQGVIISSAIIVFYGDEAFYHHGASSSKHARVPSSYLALWEAMREAKRRGIKKFNFYGIVDDNHKHPWFGLSQFKKGFGGYELNLVHCQDLPLGWRYFLTKAIETFRKIKRGY
jgi:lipid II:glycine glycyltransferase (peptidoglycan interpeptide bridge formation enzyme)